MNKLEESIIYDALMAIMDNSVVLCKLVNEKGEVADKKAYRNGIYAAAIKLQVVLGTDGMERGKRKYDFIREQNMKYVASNVRDHRASEAGSGASTC